jgi:hypothetical protein
MSGTYSMTNEIYYDVETKLYIDEYGNRALDKELLTVSECKTSLTFVSPRSCKGCGAPKHYTICEYCKC